MGNSRREILKLLGLAPVGAKTAAAEIAATLATPGSAALGLLPGLDGINPNPRGRSVAEDLLGEAGASKLSAMIQRAEADSKNKRRARIKGFEPDLASFKSVSLSHKLLMQEHRDREEFDLLWRAKELMGWV